MAADLKIHVFISYSHEDSKFARQVKGLLAAYGVRAFLAHEDIDLSQAWRDRILDELRKAGLFVPLLSKNFVKSKWTSQEIGFILSRPEAKIVPISLDHTIPFGFISHLQSRRIDEEGITDDILLPPLVQTFPRTIFRSLIDRVRTATSFREGAIKLERLVRYFRKLTPSEAEACRDNYLPKLLRTQGSHMGPKNRRALQCRIMSQEQ